VVAAQNNWKGFFGENSLNRVGNFLTGFGGDGGIDDYVADVHPALPFQQGAIAVDVVEAFGEVVRIFLGIFAQVARSIAFAWLSPGAFVERNSQDGEIGVEFVEIRLIRRAEKRPDAHEGRSGLGECRDWQRKYEEAQPTNGVYALAHGAFNRT